jgi:PPM family protein phosphatase
VAIFRGAGTTDPGPVRRHNEDAFFQNDDIGLYIVADGMGGHAAGDVAAQLAVDAVVGFIRRSEGDEEYSWPYGIVSNLSLNANRLRTAIYLANRRVFRAAEACDDYTGMGTTIVAALAWNDRLAVGHVGDSRLYRFRGDALEQLTQDDSWAAMTLGHRAHDAAPGASGMRHVLTNVLGAREETEVHVQEHVITHGERFLLCSDGVHGTLTCGQLEQVLRQRSAPGTASTAIVREALERGTRDNATALVADCGVA